MKTVLLPTFKGQFLLKLLISDSACSHFTAKMSWSCSWHTMYILRQQTTISKLFTTHTTLFHHTPRYDYYRYIQRLLSTRADRQGVDVSVTVFFCLYVCTVIDFSAKDKASGVKFCTVVHRRPRQGISHFGELAPRKPKSGRIGQRTLVVMWCF